MHFQDHIFWTVSYFWDTIQHIFDTFFRLYIIWKENQQLQKFDNQIHQPESQVTFIHMLPPLEEIIKEARQQLIVIPFEDQTSLIPEIQQESCDFQVCAAEQLL